MGKGSILGERKGGARGPRGAKVTLQGRFGDEELGVSPVVCYCIHGCACEFVFALRVICPIVEKLQ